MKKVLFAVLFLAGCNSLIKNQNDSEKLIKLDAEPKDCVYLYKIQSQAAVYSSEDAERYLENQIAEDNSVGGNAYFVTDQAKRPNRWIPFAPENTFVLSANVYNCSKLKK